MSYPNNLERILKYLNPNITGETLEKVSLHPEYPSLNTLSFVLDQYKIGNLAVRLDTSQLYEIDFPCIAHCVTAKETYFVVINAIQDNAIHFFDTLKGEIAEDIGEFEKKWKGVTLLLDINDKSEESDFKIKKRKEKYSKAENIITYSITGLIFALGLGNSASLNYFLLYGFYGAGAFVSAILVKNETGKKNKLIEGVCNLGKNVSCDAVLQSKAARLFGWLSWSEIGLFYFFGGFFSIFLSGTHAGIFPVLFLLNSLALPYVLFSLYYQAVVLRQWCPLCLAIQGFIVILFTIFYFSDIELKNIVDFSFQDDKLILLCFLVPVPTWFIIKHLAQQKQKLIEAEKERYFYKFNSDLFLGLLGKQKKEEISTFPNEISFGSRDATVVLTMVSNPYCQPCAFAHKEAIDLVEYFDIRLNIRFIGNSVEHSLINNHILNLVSTDSIGEAIDDWYELRDYEKWAARYTVDLVNFENYSNEWAQRLQIDYTPSFFINGRKLEKPYFASDLKYHLRNLLEHLRNSDQSILSI